MIGVDADDPILADLLASTLDLIADAGGWVHPRTRLVARSGQFLLECDADDDEPLLQIPRAALVRVDAVTWADEPGTLRIEALPDDVGDTELSMLYIQAALHNQADRLAWIARTHPGVAPLPDDVVGALRELVPGFRGAPTSPRDVLFADRCLRVDLGDGRGVQRVLVPVLDLVNHHAGGATPQWDGESFALDLRRPFGTSECALDYGLDRDALELAAVYGFADATVNVAHLPHLVADVPGIGAVSVRGEGRRLSGDFAPLTVRDGDAGVEISHLTFSAEASAQRRLVDELARVTGWDAATARSVLRQVGVAAQGRTREFRDLCEGGGDAVAVLRAAADRQGAVLSAALTVLETDSSPLRT